MCWLTHLCSLQSLILLFILPGASPRSVTLSSCAPIRLIIYPSRAVPPVNSHPLLPSLCLLVLFLLGIFQLGDFRSKLRQLSGLCTRAHRMGRELGVLLVWVIVLLFTAAHVCWRECCVSRCVDVQENMHMQDDEMTHSVLWFIAGSESYHMNVQRLNLLTTKLLKSLTWKGYQCPLWCHDWCMYVSAPALL